jgi:Beta-lactamase enzyme family
MRFFKISLLFILGSMRAVVAASQQNTDKLLYELLSTQPEKFSGILNNLKENKLQLIYTAIKRDKKDKVKFTDHTYNLDAGNYFYPASTVKLPLAILALQKLNELNIKGLNKTSTMITGQDGNGQTSVNNDPSAPDGRPTIANYIKKILLVSDNDAFNRLYEFLGQEYINNSLHKMGYTHIQIIHRLEVSLSEAQNRHTNPVDFFDADCNTLYKKPAMHSQLPYLPRNIILGEGYYKGDSLVHEPFNFSAKNQLPLADLHNMVRSILFPAAVAKQQRFNLTPEDYAFLRKYMSMTPLESSSPVYTAPVYWDNYVKFIYYGAEKIQPDSSIRIFNKPGDAYGFLIDAAYLVDYKNNIEFIVSAALLCNSDDIFNDDNYDYNSVGLPFMKNIGQLIYNYERTKVSAAKKQISPIVPNYRD